MEHALFFAGYGAQDYRCRIKSPLATPITRQSLKAGL